MRERLAEIVDAMQKFIYDNFNFRVAVLAGEPHNGLEGVHLSWLEAKEAEEFRVRAGSRLHQLPGNPATAPI